MTEEDVQTNSSTIELMEILVNEYPNPIQKTKYDSEAINSTVEKHYETQAKIREEIQNQEKILQYRIMVRKKKFDNLQRAKEKRDCKLKEMSFENIEISDHTTFNDLLKATPIKEIFQNPLKIQKLKKSLAQNKNTTNPL